METANGLESKFSSLHSGKNGQISAHMDFWRQKFKNQENLAANFFKKQEILKRNLKIVEFFGRKFKSYPFFCNAKFLKKVYFVMRHFSTHKEIMNLFGRKILKLPIFWAQIF